MFCGNLVPEGYLVCPACERSLLDTPKKEQARKKDHWFKRAFTGKNRLVKPEQVPDC